jgi:hypothetical protein
MVFERSDGLDKPRARPGEIRVKSDSSYSFRFHEMARPERLELPTLWFEANGVRTLTALLGVAYGPETPFFPHLAALNLAPKIPKLRFFELAQAAQSCCSSSIDRVTLG